LIIRSSLSGKERYIASVDLGSHTARFLLCRIVDAPEIFQPVVRKRFYTNLAEGFNQADDGLIGKESIKRAVSALEEFSIISECYSPEIVLGAATGIFRRAQNSVYLLNQIREKTGVNIDIVSGEEEAAITLKGIIHALNLPGPPDVFFDLGGSTTEIIYRHKNVRNIMSLPIGAFVLNDCFLKHDPPNQDEISELKEFIHGHLSGSIGERIKNNAFITGSGGTVTSLAALINGLDKKEVNPEVINGVLLKADHIRGIYNKIKTFSLSERVNLKNIDEGRAEVILAGTVAVLTIMEFFNSNQLTVSYSDILEGLILSYLEGEKNE